MRLFAYSFPPFYSPGALDFTLGFLAQVAKAGRAAQGQTVASGPRVGLSAHRVDEQRGFHRCIK